MKRLQLPPQLPIKYSTETVAIPFGLRHSLVVQFAKAVPVALLWCQFDGHIDITEPV